MPNIIRLTLFKLPDADVIQEAIKKFSTLTQDAVKDGKPYIQAAVAHPVYNDPRSQGYNFAVRALFNSKEDMDYYDNECAAHNEIKALLKPKVAGPPLVVYMDES